MSDDEEAARKIILARRARFIAAALAGAVTADCKRAPAVCLSPMPMPTSTATSETPPVPAPPSPTSAATSQPQPCLTLPLAEPTPPPTAPQVCLSPQRPPESTGNPFGVPPTPPEPDPKKTG